LIPRSVLCTPREFESDPDFLQNPSSVKKIQNWDLISAASTHASLIVMAIYLFSSFARRLPTSLAKREKIGVGFEFMRDAAAQTAVANALRSVVPKFDSDPDFRSSYGSKLLISEIFTRDTRFELLFDQQGPKTSPFDCWAEKIKVRVEFRSNGGDCVRYRGRRYALRINSNPTLIFCKIRSSSRRVRTQADLPPGGCFRRNVPGQMSYHEGGSTRSVPRCRGSNRNGIQVPAGGQATASSATSSSGSKWMLSRSCRSVAVDSAPHRRGVASPVASSLVVSAPKRCRRQGLCPR